MSKAKMTAEYASAIRALGEKERDLPCPDYLAKDLISRRFKILASPLLRSLTIRLIHSRFPNLYAFHLVRTLYIDGILSQLLEKQEIKQVIFLGAGFDTRAMRFHDIAGSCIFFELDFPHTQHMKRQRIERIKKRKIADDSHVLYIPIDFNKNTPFDLLIKHDYDSEKKSLVIWEGVTMYLPDKTVKSVLRDISEKTKKGSFLVFDYLIPKNIDANNEQGGNFVQKIDEEYIFGIEPEKLSDYVTPFGFETVENKIYSELNELYLNRSESPFIRNALMADVSPALALLKTT